MTKKHPNPVPELTIPELSEGQLEPLFRRLNLAHTRRTYQEVVDRAEKENWAYRDFLALLLAEEVAHRKQTRLQRCTRQAHFPFFKTIDEFDFTLQSTLRQSLLGSYLGPDFVTEGRSLILYGKEGRGKTHLAVAIGYRAIQNGFETLCTTAAKLIEDLSNASTKGLLHQSLSTYTRPHVLVLDEIGYLSYGPDAANVLFHVVNDRYLKKRPMIFTTNKPLTQWGKVLHDEDLAAAILDRVLERGRFIHLGGPSGRTLHLNLEEVSPAKADRLRISGINGSEFLEPTPTESTRGPKCSWFAGHKQPPNVVIHWAVNEEIVSTDDLKTCIANFRFDQIRAQFVMFGLGLARFRVARSRSSIDNDQTPAWFQRFGQVAQDRFWCC